MTNQFRNPMDPDDLAECASAHTLAVCETPTIQLEGVVVQHPDDPYATERIPTIRDPEDIDLVTGFAPLIWYVRDTSEYDRSDTR